MTDEFKDLAISLATDAAIGTIMSECGPVDEDGVRWWNVDVARGGVEDEIRFLELQRMIQGHPDETNLVRLLQAD